MLLFKLKSDGAFGSAEHSSSQVNIEVQHDQWGCPFLPARALKGVLAEECRNITSLIAPGNQNNPFLDSQKRLFGVPGGMARDQAILKISNARLPSTLHDAICDAVIRNEISAQEVLESLTTIRTRTEIQKETGTAKEKSLRKMRVILRETPFEAVLQLPEKVDENDLGLLAAGLKALRRVGVARNRGLGEIYNLQLLDGNHNSILEEYFNIFCEVIRERDNARDSN